MQIIGQSSQTRWAGLRSRREITIGSGIALCANAATKAFGTLHVDVSVWVAFVKTQSFLFKQVSNRLAIARREQYGSVVYHWRKVIDPTFVDVLVNKLRNRKDTYSLPRSVAAFLLNHHCAARAINRVSKFSITVCVVTLSELGIPIAPVECTHQPIAAWLESTADKVVFLWPRKEIDCVVKIESTARFVPIMVDVERLLD
ncbi:MAG: hypothetical protein AAGJ40_09265 [Planctomycetota bacterium]